ncbi:MAG TPA: phosphoglucomutase/phosphomannomutase family protein [Bacillota bacterium]
MARIRFGTDGWRAVIGEDYTTTNVARVAQATADWLHRQGRDGQGLIVGYDTRFQSRRFAEEAAAVLAANGIRVLLCSRPAPTPAVSWAIRRHGLAGGVMITASHNPPEYNGFKLKAHYAGPALPEMTAELERILEEQQARGLEPRRLDVADLPRRVDAFDPGPDYLQQLGSYVDLNAIGRAGLRVVVDFMHGAGRGFLDHILEVAGVEVVPVRGEPRPDFGGAPPEPIARNLRPARAAVIMHRAAAGLCLDGDADRVAAVDEDGRVVDAHRVFALLLQHLHEDRGLDGMVVKTFAGSRMIPRLARAYGLPYEETPVGFRHVCEHALRETVLIGGEESGGIGVRDHIPERDGILCNLLLLEMMVQRGCGPGQLVERLMEQVGRHHFAREDLRLAARQKEDLMRTLREAPPDRFAGFAVTHIDSLDGVKLILGDHGWILFRPSGTEPVVRIYAEADDPAKLRRLMAAGTARARGSTDAAPE